MRFNSIRSSMISARVINHGARADGGQHSISPIPMPCTYFQIDVSIENGLGTDGGAEGPHGAGGVLNSVLQKKSNFIHFIKLGRFLFGNTKNVRPYTHVR